MSNTSDPRSTVEETETREPVGLPPMHNGLGLPYYVGLLESLAAGSPAARRAAEIVVELHNRALRTPERQQGWRPIEELKGRSRVGRRIIALVGGEPTVCVWGKASHLPYYGWGVMGQEVEDFDLCEPTHFLIAPPPNDPKLIPSAPTSEETRK